MINEKALKKLEYDAVLERLSQHAVSSSGKKSCLDLRPFDDYKQSQLSLEETQQAMNMFNYQTSPELAFDDVREILALARVGSTLSMAQLLSVMRLLRTARLLYKTLSTPIGDIDTSILRSKASLLYYDKQLEEDIDFAIVSDEEMNDKASADLYAIRRKIKAINADIQQKLQSYTKQGELSKYLQDSIVTLRGDRYVLPVKQEYRSYVQGILHDQSASRSTVFIEPIAIVQLNNDLRAKLSEEKEEIQRILQSFTLQIQKVVDNLTLTQNTITDIDVTFAKVKYAVATKSTFPQLNNKGIIDIKQARHLLIDPKKVVPISIALGKDYDLVIVTGPNTGGKTVSLKTIGLLSLLAMSGMFVPAQEESKLSYFRDIFCDIGDEQSIEQNLSTFSSHITNIRDILQQCDNQSLVLIDEVGAGTEPNEGTALAVAVTEFLRKSGAKGVITTHYGLLKEYALATDRVENASMEFDPQTFAPTYKLVVGIPGSSNALAIAKRLGLNKEVIDYATASLSGEKVSFENVLQDAEALRQKYQAQLDEVAKEKANLQAELERNRKLNDSLQKERDKLLANSHLEAKQIVNKAQEQSKELLQQIKDILKQSELQEKSLFEARAIAKKLNEVQTRYESEADDSDTSIFVGDKVNFDTLKVGDRVYSKKMNTEVQVTSIKNANKIGLRAGILNSFGSIDDLYYCKAEKRQTTQSRQQKAKVNNSNAKNQVVPRCHSNEINVIGQTVADAIINVDSFIDNAILAGLSQIWVIHGMGTGRLRSGLHEHFRHHPNVQEFRLGKYGEGESGVTVVTLK